MKEAEAIEAQMKQKVMHIFLKSSLLFALAYVSFNYRRPLDPLVEQPTTEAKLNQERRKAQVILAIRQRQQQQRATNMAVNPAEPIHKV